MSTLPGSDAAKTGPVGDVPAADRAAEFRRHAKVFREMVRRVLKDGDSTSAMEKELNKRRNAAGQ